MEIKKLIRETYTGEEYLAEENGKLKRIKILKEGIITNTRKLGIYFKLLKRIEGVLTPESYSFDERITLVFPYSEEKEFNVDEYDVNVRNFYATRLFQIAREAYHVPKLYFAVLSLDDLLITKENIYLLPPLWMNYDILPEESESIFVAPEAKREKKVIESSTLYVLGKAIEALRPGDEILTLVKRLTHENPEKRTIHFNMPFSVNSFLKKSFVLPTIKRFEENKIIDIVCNKSGIKFVGVVGPQRIGKTTLLDSIQSTLIQKGKTVIRPQNGEDLILQILQVSSDKLDEGSLMELMGCLNRSCKIDTISPLIGAAMESLESVVIMVDDYQEIYENFKALLLSLKSLSYKGKHTILAFSTKEFEDFDYVINLEPFDKNRVLELVNNTFPKLDNPSPLASYIYRLSKGFPGLISEILRILVDREIIRKNVEDGSWTYDADALSQITLEQFSMEVFDLDEELKECLKYISILGQKFSYDDLESLKSITNCNITHALMEAQKYGLIYKEYERFRFTLNQYWEELYNLIPENLRKKLHLKIAESALNFTKKGSVYLRQAWHYKMAGEFLKALVIYLKVIKDGINKYFSPSFLHKLINEAEELVPEGKISYMLVRMKVEIYYRMDKRIDFEVPEGEIFEYWRLGAKFVNYQYREIIETFEKNPEKLKGLGPIGTLRRLLLYYTAKVNSGCMSEVQVHKVQEIIENLNPKIETTADVLARAYILLSRLVSDRDVSISMDYLEKAKNVAMKWNLQHLLPMIYNNIAVQMNNLTLAINFLEKSITSAEEAGLPNRSLMAKLNKVHFLLYMGKIQEFFDQLSRLRKLLELKEMKRELGYSYLLEGYYHAYNGEYKEGLEDLEKAKEIYDTLGDEQPYLRTLIFLNLFSGRIKDAKQILLDNRDNVSLKTMGFDKFSKMILAQDDAQFKKAWLEFRDSNYFLWREETFALFGKRIAKVDPEGFKEQLKMFESDYSSQDLKLPLALIYEGYSYYYREVGKEYRVQSYLSKAYSLYKEIGLENAAKRLGELYPEITEQWNKVLEYSKLARNSKFSKSIKEFFERAQFSYSVLEGMKALDPLLEPGYIINYFAGKILEYLPAEEVYIFAEDKRIERDFHFSNVEGKIPDKDIVNSNPLEIFITDEIDRYLSYGIYVSNKSLKLSKDEMTKFLSLLEIVEYGLIAMLKGAFARLRSLSDPLTLLFTRYYIIEKLNSEFEMAKRFNTPLSVIMADIDHFKKINDSYGHLLGDEVLKEIAKVLKNNVRSQDVVGRYGGEEFIIILPHTNVRSAKDIAERIREKIASINKFPEKVTMSFGVAGYPNVKVEKVEELVRYADDALYRAKALGRNRVIQFGESS
ncbi:diguanylate cyclase [Thermosipho ferrireducens]|uniref:Diguanylate cyclase n=1 Tax=Thermosipho ferrireducens TaxID=2571116 RepID=A0ABX7S904_9BACT|nr:GGDEF domain-containing protein [Thermosipho ferrireducens]QTA37818.1 diguanylate cyclase [Thermosipho ferrireducens]